MQPILRLLLLLARKLNVFDIQVISLLGFLQQSVKREETWGVSMKSYTGNGEGGRGVTKQRRVVEFTTSDPCLFLSLSALNVHYRLLGK